MKVNIIHCTIRDHNVYEQILQNELYTAFICNLRGMYMYSIHVCTSGGVTKVDRGFLNGIYRFEL